MNIRNIRLLSCGSVATLREKVAPMFREWAQGWCVDADNRFELLGFRRPVDDDVGREWSPLVTSGNTTFIAFSSGSVVLAGQLLGVTTGNASASGFVAEHLARLALEDLHEMLVGEIGSVTDTAATVDPWFFQPIAGSTIIEFQIGDACAHLLFTPELVDRYLPRAASDAAHITLHSVQTLLDTQEVELTVTLNLGEVRVKDLHDLRPGDCITTNVPLDSDFELSLGGKGTLAECQLGRSKDQRAVVIENRKNI